MGFKQFLRDVANPDNGWEYGSGLPMAADAQKFLKDHEALRRKVKAYQARQKAGRRRHEQG